MKNTPHHSRLSRLAVLAATLFACGCASTPDDALDAPLPLHLAIVPTVVLDPIAPATVDGEAADDAELLQELDSDGVSQAVRDSLVGRGFSRVTLLKLPEDPEALEAFAKQTAAEQDRYWLKQAYDRHADVLMTSKLEYGPVIDGDRNEKFWLNIPLFLLGGPMCYFINDRTYGAEARLHADFFDLSVLHDKLDFKWSYLPLPLEASFRGTSLDFVDRAGKNVASYALSILVPAGLLAKETSHVKAEVEAAALENIGESLYRELQGERGRFLRNATLCTFEVVANEVSVTRGGGGVALRVPIREFTSSSGLAAYSILHEGELLTGGDLGTGPDATGRHWIEEGLQLTGAAFVRLIVRDAEDNARAFTFRVEEVEE